MTKKSKPRKKPKAPPSVTLRPEDIREIRRRIKYHDEPGRYVVCSELVPGRGFRLFLDVSEDAYHVNDWSRATLFKRKPIARLVARGYSVGRKRPLQVARVTITAWGTRGGRAKQ